MTSVCEERIGLHRLGVNGSAPLHCEGSDSDPSSVARACTGRTAERFLGGFGGDGQRELALAWFCGLFVFFC